MNTAGVSVIVCCYNSSERLPKTLEHLTRQQVSPNIKWEVIIVDNGSTDNTAMVAQQEWPKYINIPFKIVEQPIQGLARARQKGIEESSHDLLIFCDDDNWLFENYIQRAFELAWTHKGIAAIGGQGIAVSNIELPNWFDSYKKYYACYPQGGISGELVGSTSFLYGAGLIVKKDTLQILESRGFKSFISDRIGTSLISGGDNELCYALRLAGYQLYYSEDLKFYHYIPEKRLTKEYLLKLIKGISYSSMYLVLYHYAIAGKKINRFTWLKDFLYRSYILAISARLGGKDSFNRCISRLSSYQAFIAVVNLFGSYRKNYKRLIALK
jgi:glycosyltransferase involved in cell wall biosynthesis